MATSSENLCLEGRMDLTEILHMFNWSKENL